jgi:hypothetical protein
MRVRRSLVLPLIILIVALPTVACKSPSGGGSGGSEGYNETNGATSGSAPRDTSEYDSGAEATLLGQGSLKRSWYSFSG